MMRRAQAGLRRLTTTRGRLSLLFLTCPLAVLTGVSFPGTSVAEQAAVPAVPVLPGTAWFAADQAAAWFGVVAAACVALAMRSLTGSRRRWPAAIATLAVLSVAVSDHLLLTPAMWQIVLLASFAVLPPVATLRWSMRLTISIYLFSAASKIDVGFVEGIGQLLSGELLSAIGLSPNPRQKMASAAILPFGEIVAACLLARRRTRRSGLVAATSMHLGLLTVAWRLGHSWAVINWNLFFLLLLPIQFAGVSRSIRPSAGEGLPGVLRTALWGVLALPILEPFGLWDHWPSWSVYSARPATVIVRVAAATDISPELLGPSEPFTDRRTFLLDRAVFTIADRPPYPQERYRLALAAAYVDRFPSETPFEVVIRRPDRWRRGQRHATIERITVREELAAVQDSFWLNGTATTPWRLPPRETDGG